MEFCLEMLYNSENTVKLIISFKPYVATGLRKKILLERHQSLNSAGQSIDGVVNCDLLNDN